MLAGQPDPDKPILRPSSQVILNSVRWSWKLNHLSDFRRKASWGSWFEDIIRHGVESTVARVWGGWWQCAWSQEEEERWMSWCPAHLLFLFCLGPHPVGWFLQNQGVFGNSLGVMPRCPGWFYILSSWQQVSTIPRWEVQFMHCPVLCHGTLNLSSSHGWLSGFYSPKTHSAWSRWLYWLFRKNILFEHRWLRTKSWRSSGVSYCIFVSVCLRNLCEICVLLL